MDLMSYLYLIFFNVQGIFEPPSHLWLRWQTVKVIYCINYWETAALGEEFLAGSGGLAGLADATGSFVLPSLFIPFLIIRFTFPFLPLDPAVTMGTVLTVAFHWLRKSSIFPFPVSFPFPSMGWEPCCQRLGSQHQGDTYWALHCS